MVYIYRTEVGTFTIEPDAECPGKFMLCIGGMWLDSYETAEDARAALCRQCTGWHDWDRLACPESPPDLKEWEKLD
ncbi:MAG: hypothetical protein ACE14T_03185 [Syntrophales bacterium]